MVVVDVNVLIYAVDEDSPLHEPAHSWIDEAMSGREPVGFAWSVLLAFIRLTTSPAIFPHPLTPGQAVDVVRGFIGRSTSVLLEPGIRHLDLIHGLLTETGPAGNLVNDAHLAALALAHGARVVTFDNDFERFGVPWERPGAT